MPEPGDPITLVDADGESHEFSIVDVIEVSARRYAILQPADEDESAVVFRVEDDTLVAIEDEEEFDRVLAAIQSSDEFDDVTVTDEDEDEDEDEDDAEDDVEDEDDEDDEDDEGTM
ncbi:MAG TPA: DUF1292 domain-containing protein [bacterium]|nr:DUF1292 domain-containing protein [bacterium]